MAGLDILADPYKVLSVSGTDTNNVIHLSRFTTVPVIHTALISIEEVGFGPDQKMAPL